MLKLFAHALVLLGVISMTSCIGVDEKLFPVEFHSDSQFDLNMEVPCNILMTREIGMKFVPPIVVESVSDARGAVSGDVVIHVSQGGKSIERNVKLADAGWMLSNRHIEYIALTRFPPLEGLFCGRQSISIVGVISNIDLQERSVYVYISRDRRP